MILSSTYAPTHAAPLTNLIHEQWNDTQLQFTRKASKRAYYLSLEFLSAFFTFSSLFSTHNALQWAAPSTMPS